METRDLAIGDIDRVGLLRLPEGRAIRGGIVALHGAGLPDRQQPLFEHLAATLTPLGWAVLSFDRRSKIDGNDVPITDQAADALIAVATLRAEIDAPVGLYGFSQGSWAAAQAAGESPDIAFLALVGCCGVSPAVQMRYYTDELLRRAGYDDEARTELRRARLAAEDAMRGAGDRPAIDVLLKEVAARPWFEMAYLPDEAPDSAVWTDMDFDPEPIYERVTCPTLLMYGEDEECTPVAPSAEVWRRAAIVAGNTDVTIVDVPGCGHFPAAPGAGEELESISPAYTKILIDWFDRVGAAR